MIYVYQYASGVKEFKLWCTNLKSSKFLINRDVFFDESAMLNPRKKYVVFTEKECKVMARRLSCRLKIHKECKVTLKIMLLQMSMILILILMMVHRESKTTVLRLADKACKLGRHRYMLM